MFFKKLTADRRASAEQARAGVKPPTGPISPPTLVAIDGGAPRKPGLTPGRGVIPIPQAGSEDVGLVLDTIGGMLASFGRHAFDMPDRPAQDVSSDFGRWQRHATMGVPIVPTEVAAAVGIRERDWDGVLRTFTEQRRAENRYVDNAVGELRDALWSCVETVHNAVKIDQKADVKTDVQVQRARSAISRLQTGSIKQEVLGAVAAIQEALQARRDQQELQYVSLATKLDRLGRQLEDAKRESTTDPLTGLGNRKLFDNTAQRAMQMHSLGRTPVTLILLDLNKLKFVNDMYGHQAGDAFITGVAKAMSKVFLRQSDIICRYGGDEFCAIMNNTDWKVGLTLAQRLHDQIASMPSPHPALEFQVGASMGVAQFDASEDVEEWIARADKALYKAKQGDGIAVADTPLGKPPE
ncbi:MAG: GGDEF domain-containing protein [Phycisphaerae bacterium]|nr:GGDEF domain-containing protein [Gemmatimonadaceae bacterium]